MVDHLIFTSIKCDFMDFIQHLGQGIVAFLYANLC